MREPTREGKQFKAFATPFPELVSAGWTILETDSPMGGWTDFAKKQIGIPTADTVAGLALRTQELLRVKFSPQDPVAFLTTNALKPEVRDFYAVEGARLKQALHVLDDAYNTSVFADHPGRLEGLDMALRGLPPEQQLQQLLRLGVSTMWNDEDHKAVDSLITRQFSTGVRSHIWNTVNQIRYGLADAARHTHGSQAGLIKGIKILQRAMRSRAAGKAALSTKPKQGRGHALETQDTGLKANWGKMTINYPRLITRAKYRMAARKHRATDEGVRIRAIHRLCTDKQVFQVKRKVRGGTVLIDASGSMHLTNTQILAMVAAAPAAKIALYSGMPSTGILHVVADHGETLRDDEFEDLKRGGCNVIDGPALQWLATQAEPRVWVSDGQVTEVDDKVTVSATQEAAQIVTRGAIRRLPTATKAIAAFASGFLYAGLHARQA